MLHSWRLFYQKRTSRERRLLIILGLVVIGSGLYLAYNNLSSSQPSNQAASPAQMAPTQPPKSTSPNSASGQGQTGAQTSGQPNNQATADGSAESTKPLDADLSASSSLSIDRISINRTYAPKTSLWGIEGLYNYYQMAFSLEHTYRQGQNLILNPLDYASRIKTILTAKGIRPALRFDAKQGLYQVQWSVNSAQNSFTAVQLLYELGLTLRELRFSSSQMNLILATPWIPS